MILVLFLGSSQPSLPHDGQLHLFSMRFCPFAHRVHLVLNAKKIPYHVVYINLTEKPEWYSKINPNGKVPALQLTNEPNHPFLVESLVIAEYLDEKYPEVKLYPTDPLEKAQTKLWIERFGPIPGTLYRLVYNTNSDEENESLLNTLNSELASFETELAKRNTPYFAGATAGIFDYAIWPWFERMGVLSSIVGDKYNFDEQFPKLVSGMLIAMLIGISIQFLVSFFSLFVVFFFLRLIGCIYCVKMKQLKNICCQYLRTQNSRWDVVRAHQTTIYWSKDKSPSSRSDRTN